MVENSLLHVLCDDKKDKMLSKKEIFMKEFLLFLAFLKKDNKGVDVADLLDCVKKYTCSDFTDEEICCLFNNPDFERVFNENEIYS